jgi:poly-gamma-glutamate synthesis protein (capsule biosynthesis protein)
VPGSIEVYRERPIFYSLGNFCFGHDHEAWRDNMMVKLDIAAKRLRRVEVVPIGGRYAPHVLAGEPARAVHQELARISSRFGTKLTVEGERSYIDLF